MGKRRIWTTNETSKIARDYRAGTSIKALARLHSTGVESIHAILDEYNIPRRTQAQRVEAWRQSQPTQAHRRPAQVQVDADRSGPALARTLARMEQDERDALIAAWQEERQAALATRRTTGQGSRRRILATLRAAEMAARLRAAQAVGP